MIYGMPLLPYKYRGPYIKKGGLLTTTGKEIRKIKRNFCCCWKQYGNLLSGSDVPSGETTRG